MGPLTAARLVAELGDPARIVAAWREIRDGAARPACVPPLWDGRAAERIADALLTVL